MGLKGDIVKEYLAKFPDTPNKTLANLIYKENKSVFKNAESVRDNIRYYTGARGDKKPEDKSFVNPNKPLNPFDKIPEGMTSFDDWSPVEIYGNKILILGDIHIPYHNKEALEIALNHGLENNIDTIFFMGDCIDFHSVSFWQKDPRERDIQNELNIFYSIMEHIRSIFPDIKIYYKIGNHEERFERYMQVKAPELLGLNYLSFESLMNTDKFDIELIKDKRIAKIGKLNAIHGHEFARGFISPVNPARGLFLRAKETCIAAHNHRTSEHVEKTMTNDIIACWSIGCLCDLNPDYMPINAWNHGFAIVKRSSSGDFEVDNKKIINGKVY